MRLTTIITNVYRAEKLGKHLLYKLHHSGHATHARFCAQHSPTQSENRISN